MMLDLEVLEQIGEKMGNRMYNLHMSGANDTRVDSWDFSCALASVYDTDTRHVQKLLDQIKERTFKEKIKLHFS